MEEQAVLQQILAEIKGLKTDMSGVQAQVSGLNEKMGRVEKEMVDIQKEVGNLRNDVGDLRNDVGDLRKDVGDLQKDVGDLQKDVGDLKTEQTKVRVLLENDISKKVTALFEGHQLSTQKLNNISDVLEDLEASSAASDIMHSIAADEIIKLKIVK